MRRILLVGTLLCIGIFLTGTASASNAAVQRPIEDFVDQQGTFCIPDGAGGCFLIVPPIENFIGWTDAMTGIGASVDYAGLADDWAAGAFGTETTGTVTERPLPDGRAEIHVRLRTENALTFVVAGGDFAGGELLFGNRAPEVLAGAAPALGESFLHVRFVNTAPGDPLPDLIQLLIAPEPGQELKFIAFKANVSGPLPDGTPGRVTVVQTGLFMTPFKGAVADGFPAEFIKIHAAGQ